MNIYDLYQDFLVLRAEQKLLRNLSEKSTQNFLDFSSNDTLGLSNNPVLKEAWNAYTPFGVGARGSRLLCDQQHLFETVEQEIARLKGTETALLFASGFQANISVIAALLDVQILKQKPLVFTDKFIHASMHQGCELAKVHQIRFRHQDFSHLQARLEKYKNASQPKFIFVESLYGMEGSITPLEMVVALAQDHNAFLYVDEAHATGIYGEGGSGFSRQYAKQIDVVLGTFSKALGSFGGFIACNQRIKHYLLNRCQGVIYSTALPPPLLGVQLAALQLLPHLESERQHLQNLANYTKEKLMGLSCPITLSNSHIFGVVIPNIEKAMQSKKHLEQNGILVSLIRPPTVEFAKTRLRISLTVHHTHADIDRLIQHLGYVLS